MGAVTPGEGVAVSIPVLRGRFYGLTEVLPRGEATPLQRQRTQHLAPRLDEMEIGGVLRLEGELPAGMGQRPQQHVRDAVGRQVAQSRQGNPAR